MANANIQIEITALDKASRKLDAISKSLNPMKGKVGKIDKEFDKVDKSIKRTSGSFGKFKGLLAGAITVAGITSFTKSVVEASSRAEDLKTTLETVAGSAKAGDDAFKFINDFATRTPFDIETLTETFIKLKASGIEPTEELLTTFGDMASVTTDRVGSLNAITDLFARTTSGGLGLEDLNRLADRGIPVFKIFEEKLGLARLEVSEFGKSAEGAAQLKDALLEGLNEDFGGGMEKASKNLSVSLSNMGIAANNALIAVGEGGLSDAINKAATTFTSFLGNNEELALALGEKLGQAVTFVTDGIIMLFENAHKAQPIFDLLGVVFKDVVAPAAVLIFDALVKVSEILTPMIEATIPLAKSVFEGLGKILQDYIVPAFETVVAVAKDVIEFVGNMIDRISAGIEKAAELVGAGKEFASAGWNKAKDAVGGAADAVANLGGDVASSVGNGLSDAGSAVKDFAEDGLKWLGFMENEAVGNSIVPDMVNSIGDWMGRLQSILSDPVAIGVDASLSSMDMMGTMIDSLGEKLRSFSDQSMIMTQNLMGMSAAASLSSQSLGKVNMNSLDSMTDKGIPVYQEIYKKLGLNREEANIFAKSDEGSSAIKGVISNMNRSTSGAVTSNTNFNISGVTINNGDKVNSLESTKYIEGIAVKIAHQVLRQNTRFGGLV